MTLVAVGRIVRAQGLRGEVRLQPLTDDPARLADLADCWLVPPASGERRQVEGLRFQGAIPVLKLAGADARGGAALSIRSVTGKPIVFCGVGERTDALEPFHPDRMASRILGMGDVLSLVEKAQATVDTEKAEELARKIQTESFSLEDFAEQLRQVRKMGPLEQVLDMVPFFKGAKPGAGELDAESQDLQRFEAIINSMTLEERRNAAIIGGDRRARIARGSGTSVQDVNRLLKQYAQLRKMMKGLRGMKGRLGRKELRQAMPFLRG